MNGSAVAGGGVSGVGTEHPSLSCLAQIVVTPPGGKRVCGSGYRVAAGWVLTAAHVVREAAEVGVWFGAQAELRTGDGVGVEQQAILFADEADVALLPVPEDKAPDGFVPVQFGLLDRDSTDEVAVRTLGFPWFKLRPLPIGLEPVDVADGPGRPAGRVGDGELLREVAAVAGRVIPAGNAKTGTFALKVSGAPDIATQPSDSSGGGGDGELSVWAGMSGAGVWVSHRLVGVAGQHHLLEGADALTVWPLDTLAGAALEPAPEAAQDAGTSAAGVWWGVVPNLVAPTVVTLPSRRSLSTMRARRAAEKLAPAQLTARTAELAELDEFATSSARWRWVSAATFAGKTALVAWWAAHHQLDDQVEVVGCFLRRTTGENTAAYALEVLSGQLASLADPPGGEAYRSQQSPSAAAAEMLDELLPAATKSCRERGRRLLIIVDGLDEYGTTPGQILISEWLPDQDSLPQGAALLVTSRAGVAIELPIHPLRQHVHPLAPVEAAEQIHRLAQEEVKQALARTESLAYPILGFLAAAGAELTLVDLTHLIKQQRPHVLGAQLDTVLDAELARTVTASRANIFGGFNTSGGGDTAGGYSFSHDALRAEANRRIALAEGLAGFREGLHDWADDHACLGWPEDTPAYLLTGYTRMLADEKLLDRLVCCAADTARHTRLLAATRADAAALAEIRAAQELICAYADPDLAAMGRLAYHRDTIAGRNSRIPPGLPATWARLGQPDRATALAHCIPDSFFQEWALAWLVTALAVAGEQERAEALAVTITDPDCNARAQASLVIALADAREHERAETLAQTITDPYSQALALAALVTALAAAGEHARVVDVAEHVQTLVQTLTDPESQAKALVRLVHALAAAGEHERAVDVAEQVQTLVQTLPDPDSQGEALVWLVYALAGAGEHERAVAVAEQVRTLVQTNTDPDSQADALVWLVKAWAAAGQHQAAVDVAEQVQTLVEADPDPASQWMVLVGLVHALAAAGEHQRAVEVAEQVQTLAGTITDLYLQAAALAALAAALAAAGEHRRAVDVAERAETVARTIPYPQGEALAGLVKALAAAGEGERAEAIASIITDRGWQARALTELVRAASAVGEDERAETLAHTITDPNKRASALAEVAGALAAAGEHQRAVDMAATITDPAAKARALTGLVEALAADGAHQAAVDMAEQVRTTAQNITNPDSQAEALAGLVKALIAIGDHERAESVAGTKNEPSRHAGAQVALVTALAAAGEYRRAETFARTITDLARQGRSLAGVVEALIAAGDLERAESVAGTISDPGWQAGAQAALVTALAAAGELGRAETLAHTITDPNMRASALIALVKVLAAAGEEERAETLAHTITDPDFQTWALTGLVEAFVAAGKNQRAADLAKQAETLAHTITDPNMRASALSALVKVLAAAGEEERAETLAHTITDPNMRASALIDLAQAAVVEGDGASVRRSIAVAWSVAPWSGPLHALAQTDQRALLTLADEVTCTYPGGEMTAKKYHFWTDLGFAAAAFLADDWW